MAGAKPKPTDFTGVQRQKLIEENQEALKIAAQQMSIATAVEQERIETEVVDYSHGAPKVERPADQVESVGVDVADAFETIQPIESLEQVTFGAGNIMSFEAGRKYKVPASLAAHLREKGYIY